jgi:hypothetical protein
VIRLEHEERVRERWLLRGLLGLAEGEAADAASGLLGHSLLARAPQYAVLAVAPDSREGVGAPDAVCVRLTAAMDRLRRTMPPRHLRLLVVLTSRALPSGPAVHRAPGIGSAAVTRLPPA